MMGEEGHTSYPVEKEERRRRNLSRNEHSDRRGNLRYEADFPVEIIVGKGEDRRVYKAHARDISDGGLLLDEADLPAEEEQFRIAFKIPNGTMPEEYIHGAIKTEASIRRLDGDHQTVGLEFSEPLTKKLARSSWNLLRLSAIAFLVLSFCLILFIKYQNLYFFWFDVPVFLYSLLVGTYLISRFLFAGFYREPKPLKELPSMSVIVPAHNEEELIGRTIRQILESEYPEEKLQLIVVNDGSTDNTLESIEQSREKYPETILVNFTEPQGKRHAMAAGIKIARGDILVFTDSDSFLRPDALRNVVRPFQREQVAAVTGHCEVENQWTNMLTKMQAVRYFIAFRIIKAAESVFGCVTCLSGPLSAYRREPLMEILDEWLNQTFAGIPTTFGDDRSLTNSLLKRHYKVVYEATARLTTMVPDKFSEFMHQQMRWKRSWFRESLRASLFMWQKEPLMAISFYLGFILPMLAPLIVLRALVLSPIFEQIPPVTYIGGVFLMSVLMSCTYLFAKRSRLWLYGIHFCFIYMFILVWQVPWAALTCAQNKWGTRTGDI